MSVEAEAAVGATESAVPPLGRRVKLLYGVGGIGNALRNSLFALFTVYFYTTVLGLPGALVGVAAVIGLLSDLVFDPLIGHLSDHTRFRLGRQGFMLAGSVTMGAGFWALFSPPAGLSQGGLFAWLLATSLIGRMGMAVFTIPYFAVGAELSQDYRERTAVAGTRGILVLLATLVAASSSFVLFFPNDTPGVDPKLNVDGYASLGWMFGLVIALTGVVSVVGTRRTGAGSAASTDAVRERAVSFSGLVEALRNRSFRLVFVSFVLFFLGVVFNTALAIHYLSYYVGIGSSAALGSFQLAFYCGAVLGMVIWLRLARFVDKHVLHAVAALVTAGLALCAFLLVGDGHLLGTGGVRAMLIGHALGGCLCSIVWFMPQSMIADVSDEEELATGRRREGSFFGFFYLGRQLAVGAAALLAGVLLDWFAGFQAGAAVQSAGTVWRIGLLFGLVPAVVIALSGLVMLRYTLSEQRVAAIRMKLNSRRALSA